MRPIVPLLGLLAVAGCTGTAPGYSYGPASYGTPQGAPYGPASGRGSAPVQIAPPLIATTPLPPPGTFLPDRPVAEPTPDLLPPVDVPPVRDPVPAAADLGPAQVDPAPPPPPPSDPVTDLLLAPSGTRGTPAAAASPATPAAAPSKQPTTAPDGNPMMGFRPMRGQTAPSL